jgi:hypothetical protein
MIIILLSRVITKLGDVQNIDTKVIESLFSVDLEYLQTFYQAVNAPEEKLITVNCPNGESVKIPLTEILSSGE